MLGDHPPSNSFLTVDQIQDEKMFPLDVYICNSCYLVQLIDVVSAENIFNEYYYLSSSSKALVNHFSYMTADIMDKFDLLPRDIVVDIGCNDGITLDTYQINEIVKIGVEPSDVAKLAKQKGHIVINQFFSDTVAEDIVRKFGRAKIITATNVFAHVDDIHSFVLGIPILLSDEGVFIIEVSYLLDLVEQNLFDTVYHEHLCYLSLTSVIPFLKKYDLDVFKVERYLIGASGPSVRFFIQKSNYNKRSIDRSVEEMLIMEYEWGVHEISTYRSFSERIQKVKKDTISLISELKEKKYKIGGFGAPAKGNTLINYYKLTNKEILCIAENNLLKQGMLTPGSHIPIISDNEFLENRLDFALLLSWNYKEYFLENSEYIRQGGKFIIPLPTPQILPQR